MSKKKIAIVYDRANTEFGGAEYLLLVLHQAFPEADLFSPLVHPTARWIEVFPKVKSSWLQKIPWANQHHQWLATLMPLAVESLDLASYDLIISVTSAESKGVLTKPNQRHICYLLTPPRYLYEREDYYHPTFLRLPLIKELSKLIFKYLRWWDQAAIARVDLLLTLSNKIEKKIEKYYSRKAQVIYPPIKKFKLNFNKNFNLNSSNLSPFFLSVSRLVEYKRVDLAIKLCLDLKTPLIIVGTGSELGKLQKIAGNNAWTRPADMNFQTALKLFQSQKPLITFMGKVTDVQLAWLYQHAQVLLSLGNDDFGLVPLEAAQFGLPSIIYQKSGVAEILTAPKFASHFKDHTIDSLKKALHQLQNSPPKARDLRNIFTQHSEKKFIKDMTKIVYHNSLL